MTSNYTSGGKLCDSDLGMVSMLGNRHTHLANLVM